MLLRDIAHYIEQENSTKINCDTKNQRQSYTPSYEGFGIGIAILDTGLSPVDDFLLPKNRIVAFRDFVGGKDSPYDDNGHGTHVWYSCSYHLLFHSLIHQNLHTF